jgi:hypothetical protein
LAREPDNPCIAVFAPLLIEDDAELRARGHISRSLPRTSKTWSVPRPAEERAEEVGGRGLSGCHAPPIDSVLFLTGCTILWCAPYLRD